MTPESNVRQSPLSSSTTDFESTTTRFIPLDRLRAHPGNANIMPPRLLRALRAQIEAGGRYPPLIVRPHPREADAFELLDGHHRARALRELNHDSAWCDVWERIDDARALELLLTLNRLEGSDDPLRRARLIAQLRDASRDATDAAIRRLPDDEARLKRLLAMAAEARPPLPARPTRPQDWLQPVTFFLSSAHRSALLNRLDAIGPDRNRALVTALRLDEVDGQ